MYSGGSTVELDFYPMEEESRAARPKPLMMSNKLSERRRSFREIQSVITKMNPEVVKGVIGCSAGSAKPTTITVPSFSASSSSSFTPREHLTDFPMIPTLMPIYVAPPPTIYRYCYC
nr:protein TIFY 9-like [Coffea arabica]XP_027099466.1 protein TIFY 9 [Coffea arabica]